MKVYINDELFSNKVMIGFERQYKEFESEYYYLRLLIEYENEDELANLLVKSILFSEDNSIKKILIETDKREYIFEEFSKITNYEDDSERNRIFVTFSITLNEEVVPIE